MKKSFYFSLLTWITLVFCGCGSSSKIEFVQHEDRIDIMADKQLISSYLLGLHLSKPTLFPVYSPSGEVVTRGFPLNPIEGESTDHPHHTGIYFTYGNGEVNGHNFWSHAHDRPPLNMNPKLPQIRQVKVKEMKGGIGKGKLATVNHWVDKNNKPLLIEDRVMEFYARENEYKIDFNFILTAVDTVVTFKDTKEGMFAIRVADWLAENASGKLFQSTGEYLNAEGDLTEKNIWAKRSAWVRLEGDKDGKKIGIAIFHHPESLNYPTYWHARAYGCFSANPIGQYDFQKGTGHENPQHRSLVLKPGESALFRFRMIIYDGTRNKEQLDKEFTDFSKSI